MITYKATGTVLGNLWGSGIGGYSAEILTSNSLTDLERQIMDGIKDGSLDSGMGYESLIGAIMSIETIDTRIIDGKTFTSHEYDPQVYGELSEEQIDFLTEAAIYS